MSKNRYFLMSRDCESNEVVCIPFSESEIIKNGDSEEHRENSLCDIDLFTTRFSDKSSLIVYLYNKGIISSYDNDIFITSRNGDNINTMECVYRNDQYGQELRSIAGHKRKGKYDNGSIAEVFNSFSKKMYSDSNFYNYVIYGFSDIYPKFVDYYRDCHSLSTMYGCKLRDGAWAMNSYHLIRNIVESFSGFKKMGMDIFSTCVYEKERIENLRKSVEDDINFLTGKSYVDGQISLFGVKESPDMNGYILESLNNLESTAFILGEDISFNKDFFPKYEGDAFKDEICSLLDSNTLRLLFEYAKAHDIFKKSHECDLFDSSNEMDRIKKALLNEFRVNPELLHKVYSFFLLYNKCMRDNGMDSGEYGRVYNKK